VATTVSCAHSHTHTHVPSHQQSPSPDHTDDASVDQPKSAKGTTLHYWKDLNDQHFWIIIESATFYFHFFLVTGDAFGIDTKLCQYAYKAFDTAFENNNKVPSFEVTHDMVTTVSVS
jgi:hypothetical protein